MLVLRLDVILSLDFLLWMSVSRLGIVLLTWAFWVLRVIALGEFCGDFQRPTWIKCSCDVLAIGARAPAEAVFQPGSHRLDVVFGALDYASDVGFLSVAYVYIWEILGKLW